jgi:hypothetical protein
MEPIGGSHGGLAVSAGESRESQADPGRNAEAASQKTDGRPRLCSPPFVFAKISRYRAPSSPTPSLRYSEGSDFRGGSEPSVHLRLGVGDDPCSICNLQSPINFCAFWLPALSRSILPI